jgi:hypothetical protein
MFARFTPSARAVVVRAGMLAIDAGRPVLGTDYLLLALAERDRSGGWLGVAPEAVRAELSRLARCPGRPERPDDRELLAAIGIDLDEVRRRIAAATSVRVDDPARWRLRRSLARPLRITLTGPASELVLAGQSRKVIEVALWARHGRPLVTEEGLLWGLLADGSNDSVRILCGLGVDLRALWSRLRRWQAAA